MAVEGSSSSSSSGDSTSMDSQGSPFLSVKENGCSNKRKFPGDLLFGESNTIATTQNDLACEFSAENFENGAVQGQSVACDVCGVGGNHSVCSKIIELASALALEAQEFHDADWSDLAENELEELLISSLHKILRIAIEKIVGYGYTEEVATNAILLRSGLCYGCKDILSNIVDNTLAFLGSGRENDLLREPFFEDLEQLEKYVLAELVCVLREVMPFLTTGDAMWYLLIGNMYIPHGCPIDADTEDLLDATENQLKTESEKSEPGLLNPCNSLPLENLSHSSQSVAPSLPEVPSATKLKNSVVYTGGPAAGTSVTSVPEKITSSEKTHSGSGKRDYILRQKSLNMEKSYRRYGTRVYSRSGKLCSLNSLLLDKKLKPISSSVALKISKSMVFDTSQDGKNFPNTGSSSPKAYTSEAGPSVPAVPHQNIPATSPMVSISSALADASSPPILSAADTEPCLSLPTKKNAASMPACLSGIPYDKSLGKWLPRDNSDVVILKLVPKVQLLQNQLEEWTEWANRKVMQAARRLGKDKAELKRLKQEKEKFELVKQELQESTMQKILDIENDLGKSSEQVTSATSAIRRLEVENAALRKVMEVAKLQANKSAERFQEVSKREKENLSKCSLWEKDKTFLQEELVTEKQKVSRLLKDLEQVKQLQEQHEARWQQEEKAKEELLVQARSIQKEKEESETSAKAKEEHMKLKAETNMQKLKDDIQKLEKEISQLRLETDSSKIAALRQGVDGSFASKTGEMKTSQAKKYSTMPHLATRNFHDYPGIRGVKRERECVMCLVEEISVVFLPCAHQVVCMSCNEDHQKQGMQDCPSCRSTIQHRILVRYARP